MNQRTPYPSDVSDDEWALVAPYLTLLPPEVPQRTHDLREVFNVVKLPEARQGFVLVPRRWMAERAFAWQSRFRRLARDYERLPETVTGLHFVAFICLLLHQFIKTGP